MDINVVCIQCPNCGSVYAIWLLDNRIYGDITCPICGSTLTLINN